jgi:hypothetical protein
MATELRLRLSANAQQHARLVALQVGFAELCNAISPVVQQTRVWNRVALHHMVYRPMRSRFPAMGSQMVCNAVYSVSRAARLVFQTAGSPLHVNKLGNKPLPLIRFTDRCPVYFDRHTLSVKGAQMSMFTLDGRMKFELQLTPVQQAAFVGQRILEMMLLREGEQFELRIHFDPATVAPAPAAPRPALACAEPRAAAPGPGRDWPRAVMAPPAPPVSLHQFLQVEDVTT